MSASLPRLELTARPPARRQPAAIDVGGAAWTSVPTIRRTKDGQALRQGELNARMEGRRAWTGCSPLGSTGTTSRRIDGTPQTTCQFERPKGLRARWFVSVQCAVNVPSLCTVERNGTGQEETLRHMEPEWYSLVVGQASENAQLCQIPNADFESPWGRKFISVRSTLLLVDLAWERDAEHGFDVVWCSPIDLVDQGTVQDSLQLARALRGDQLVVRVCLHSSGCDPQEG